MDRIRQATQNVLRKKIWLWLLILTPLLLTGEYFTTSNVADAAENNIVIQEINYYNSTITLKVNTSDTAVYFSDSTMKKWDKVSDKISNTGIITMDISWVTAAKNYVMNFKGDYSTGIVSVTIPKRVTKFKAGYNKTNGTITFGNTDNRLIEWRKKGSTTWNPVNQNTISTEMSYFYTNGAQIIYRLAPVNGTSASNPGSYPSNEVTVSIPKKTVAPSITVNGSKFNILMKKGMAYRKLNSDGTSSEWITINSQTELLLSEIAPEVLYGFAQGQKEANLQFRTNAGTSSQVSNVTTITIPVQKGAPSDETYGISINYTSSSNLSLTVKAASSTIPFEYTIISKDKTLQYQTAVWKAITAGTAISINSEAAPVGSRIYVRMKAVDASTTVSFALASYEKEITGVNGVEYPVSPKATQVTKLVSTAGVCRSDISSSYLTFYLYSPTSTTVSAIDFYDVYGVNKGSVTFKSSVASNTKSTEASDKYIITTKITSTSNIDSLTQELLYANITFTNQEIIKSSATAGVILYLYPGTKVNNPSGSDYSSNFNRIYLSNDANDPSYFKFQLDFGTAKVVDPSDINKFTATATAINTIKYNGYSLVMGTDYSVEYSSYLDENRNSIATAMVRINAANLEKNAGIKTIDQALPLTITLNNEEILDDQINITMTNTATIDNKPIAWSMTEGSLTEKETATITNTDGSKTTTTQDVITYAISLSLFSNTYGVGLSNVTWGDTSIFGSATVSNGKVIIYLSNAKINKLTTNSTDTKNIVITFSNGFIIDSGCKLTILNAN